MNDNQMNPSPEKGINYATSKVCKSCKSVVPLGAKKCMYCQSDLRSWPTRHPILTILFGLFMLPIVLGSVIPKNDTSIAPKPTTKTTPPVQSALVDLNATVAANEDGITIASQQPEAVTDCTLRLNDDFKAGPYYFQPKQSVIIPFSDFTGKNSTRFNYFVTKPQKLSVICNKPIQRDNLWSFQ